MIDVEGNEYVNNMEVLLFWNSCTFGPRFVSGFHRKMKKAEDEDGFKGFVERIGSLQNIRVSGNLGAHSRSQK